MELTTALNRSGTVHTISAAERASSTGIWLTSAGQTMGQMRHRWLPTRLQTPQTRPKLPHHRKMSNFKPTRPLVDAGIEKSSLFLQLCGVWFTAVVVFANAPGAFTNA
eukprot:836737-Prymnesium_polylepis.1